MFDPSQPFADPGRGQSEYDPVLHAWLDRPVQQPFELQAAAIAAGIGGILAIGLAIAAVHEAGRRT